MANAYPGKGGKFVGDYKDRNGNRVRFTGTHDKTTTLKIARERETRERLIKEGMIDLAEEKQAEEARKSMAEHLDAYRDALLAKGDTAKHANATRSTLARLFESTKIRSTKQITSAGIETGLKRIIEAGKSSRTHNAAKQAAKAFCKWLWNREILVNQVRGLDTLGNRNQAADRRVVRRALKTEEVERLLTAAQTGKPIDITRKGYQYEHREVTGPDRAMLYRIILGSGLRANEIRTLTPEAFDLGDQPTIEISAGNEKARRGALQPITRELADQIRPWLQTRRPREPLFDLPEKMHKRLLLPDLVEAGIPERDDEGAKVDIHALRTTYITRLVEDGVHPAVAQRLARHSDINITMRYYTKLDATRLRNAMEGDRAAK